MLKYLSKFMLEALPSIVATVIGAYIVANYISPKTDAPKAPVAAETNATEGEQPSARIISEQPEAGQAKTASKGGDPKTADPKPGDPKTTDPQTPETKTPETKAPETKTGETKGDTKVVGLKPGADRLQPEPAPSGAAKSVDAARAAEKGGDKAATDKKDANVLARAAIERLRGMDRGRASQQETPPALPAPRVEAATSVAPSQAVAAAPATPAPLPAAAASAPSAAAPTTIAPTTAAPPLPPPVVVAAPNYGRRAGEETGNGQLPAEIGSTGRLVPPAEIPGPARELQDGAVGQPAPVARASIADHVLSTTKSFFRVFTPNAPAE